MTKKEMVVEILREHPYLTSMEIKSFVFHTYGEVISPQSAAGILRQFVATGQVSKSKGDKGKVVYWFPDTVKTVMYK